MLTQTAIEHFGSQTALAAALGIGQSSVAEWGKHPPPLRQMQIEYVSGGRLKAEKYVLPQRTKAR